MALYRHTLLGAYTGEIWTFRVHSDGNVSLAAAQSAWSSGIGAFGSVAYLGDLPATCSFTEITTAELDPVTGGQLTKASDPRSEVGTSAAAGLPMQIAPVVSLRTLDASRRGRGRFYAPSPAVDTQAEGRMTTTARGNLADSAEAMFNALQAAGLTPVLYGGAGATPLNLTSLDVGDVVDTQRRRRNKLIESRTSRLL